MRVVLQKQMGLPRQSAYTVPMPNTDYTPWYVTPKRKCQLSDFATEPPDEGQLSGDELDEHLADMGEKLDKLQSTLHAAKTRGLLVVFQGMDTSGKDGVSRSVFTHGHPLVWCRPTASRTGTVSSPG